MLLAGCGTLTAVQIPSHFSDSRPRMNLLAHITVNEYPLLSFLFGAGTAVGVMLAWKLGAALLRRGDRCPTCQQVVRQTVSQPAEVAAHE